MNPSTTSSSCVRRSSAGTMIPSPYSDGRRNRRIAATRAITTTRDDHVPRVAVERRNLQRPREVVRQEERRQGDHDHVVEEERPPGHETGEVVRRATHERRRATRLGQRGRPLRVGQRDDQEQEPDEEQHERREAERVRCEHAEREVDRRSDLAIGDREERPRVELAAQTWQLPCYRDFPRSIQNRPRRLR